MRISVWFSLLALLVAAGCHRQTVADAVEQNYDTRADALDRRAVNQSTSIAKDIYRDQADALRQEGEERARGLDKAGVGHAPETSANESR